MMQGAKELYEFDHLLIVKEKEGWVFEVVDEFFEFVVCYSKADLKFKPFSDFDTCFRAARKWMRDHQNEIYQ